MKSYDNHTPSSRKSGLQNSALRKYPSIFARCCGVLPYKFLDFFRIIQATVFWKSQSFHQKLDLINSSKFRHWNIIMYIWTDLNFNLISVRIRFFGWSNKSDAVHGDYMAAPGHHQKSAHYPDVALTVDGAKNLPDCWWPDMQNHIMTF